MRRHRRSYQTQLSWQVVFYLFFLYFFFFSVQAVYFAGLDKTPATIPSTLIREFRSLPNSRI